MPPDLDPTSPIPSSLRLRRRRPSRSATGYLLGIPRSGGRATPVARRPLWASGWLGAIVACLACLTLALAPTARADVLAVHAQPAVWLAPVEDGVAALLADGTVVLVRERGTNVVARGWTGERIWGCGAAVYGLDGRGRIVSTGGRTGPGVAEHSTPACLPDGDLVALAADARTVMRLGPHLGIEAQAPVDALADTIVSYVDRGDPEGSARGFVALLAEPTFRYRHGVLGDEVEAGAVVVLRARDLSTVARWHVGVPAVIEQRGVLPYAFDGREGFWVTRSTAVRGAGVVALELVPTASGGLLRPSTAAPAIGTGNRWLHLFAATGSTAYAVRTPHLGGPLERYRLDGATVTVDRYDLGVTSHVLGSRNLSLGAILSAGAVDRLVLPKRDLHALRVIACAEYCRVTQELRLSGRVHSNVAVASADDGASVVWAADDAGAIHRFHVDADETRF